MKKQIFVVEGKNDISRLKQVFPNINVVSVNGSEIDLTVITYLKSLVNTHDIILVLDPDYMGLQIRKTLENIFPTAQHIFIERNKAYSRNGKKIGLEHLSNKEIINLLNNIYIKTELSNNLKLIHLFELGLVGINSRERRKVVTDYFNLGFCNGKTLLKRLNESNIKITEIEKVLKER